MIEFFKAGGWIMIPILLASVVSISIFIERLWVLQSKIIAPPTLLPQILVWIKNRQMTVENIKRIRESSYLGRIFAAAINQSAQGRELSREAAEEESAQVLYLLEKNIGMLGTIANVAPLLGLLGTVIGMIQVFNVITNHGIGDPTILAEGISAALITTAAGLIVAIPAVIFQKYFHNRVDGLVLSMEQSTSKLLDALHSNRKIH